MKNSEQLKTFSKIFTPRKVSGKTKRLRKKENTAEQSKNNFSLLKNFLHELQFEQNNSFKMYNREVI